MKICTVANQKGGVGKTTTVATLAGILSERGYRVLMVDCDPHASLTSYFGFDENELPYTLYDWFANPPSTAKQVHNTLTELPNEKLHFVSASLGLATLDKNFSQKEGMGLIIKRSLALVEEDFDFVLLDCPPILGVLLINALAACEYLLIPVQTEFLAIKGLERMMNTLNMVIKAQHHSIDYRIVPTMFDKRTTASIKALRNMRDEFGGHLWERVIPVDTKFRDASRIHKTAGRAYPDTHGVEAYKKLADSLISMTCEEKVA